VNGSLLSDLEVARLEHPSDTDVARVRRLARETVAELELTAPVDPAVVASYRGITRIEEVVQPWAGCLTHDDGETVARIRITDSPRRKRFTACHEINHTYLPGFALTQFRCDPDPNDQSEHDAVQLERLADIGASELLLPHHEFTLDMAGNRLDFDLIDELADHYDASLLATALRAITLTHQDAALLCLEEMTKPTEPDAEPVLRIAWSSTQGDWPYIPRHKSIPQNHPINRALFGELVDETTNLHGITRSPIDHVDLSCRPSTYVDHHGQLRTRVLALATRH
jgi:Zn-dependent peptidase ImmA (M78 family)